MLRSGFVGRHLRRLAHDDSAVGQSAVHHRNTHVQSGTVAGPLRGVCSLPDILIVRGGRFRQCLRGRDGRGARRVVGSETESPPAGIQYWADKELERLPGRRPGTYVVMLSDDDSVTAHFLERCSSLITDDIDLSVIVALGDVFSPASAYVTRLF